MKTQFKSMEDVLKSIDVSHLPKDSTTNEPNLNGKSLSITGEASQGLVRLSSTGSQHGETGYVRISDGTELAVQIKRNQGIAAAPSLTARDWRLIDDAIARDKYDNPTPTSLDEQSWAPVLVQARAALEPAPYEAIITRLTRLKLQKPTQAMDERSTAVFLEDIAEQLEKREYSYPAIDEGISKLIEEEDDKFFPTMKTLIQYIHPIHWQLKRRADKIEELLR